MKNNIRVRTQGVCEYAVLRLNWSLHNHCSSPSRSKLLTRVVLWGNKSWFPTDLHFFTVFPERCLLHKLMVHKTSSLMACLVFNSWVQTDFLKEREDDQDSPPSSLSAVLTKLGKYHSFSYFRSSIKNLDETEAKIICGREKRGSCTHKTQSMIS